MEKTHNISKLWNVAKAVLKRNFRAVKEKKIRSEINRINFHLRN